MRRLHSQRLTFILIAVAGVLAVGSSGTQIMSVSLAQDPNANLPTTRKTTRTPAQSRPGKAAAAESAYWESIKYSKDPRDFENYLKKYPRGRFAKQARDRKRALAEAADAARKKEAKPSEQKQPPAVISDRKLPPEGTSASNWLGMQLVYVWPEEPEESFLMGSETGRGDEQPAHLVKIKDGFYMGQYEVRQGEWYPLMGPGLRSHSNGDDLPMEEVSWVDVQSFLGKLNHEAQKRRDKFEYRLPTEAEWEYACRAGTTGDYSGDLGEIAWYAHNSGDQTHHWGTKQPNVFGLYDMHGNVWEWCQDVWHDSYVGAPVDGSAWMSGGNQSLRVVRGGSYHDPASSLRSASRWEFPRGQSDQRIGFRVVAVPRRP